MADPVTPYVGLTKPTVGADNNNWGDLLNGNTDLLDAIIRAIVPAGAIFPFAGAATPTGFLFCNGQAVSRSSYADLFAAIGTTWGGGDGSTTFNVPDMRDRFPIGAGTTYALGAGGGAASFTPTISIAAHALTIAELPSHDHGFVDHGHAHGITDPGHGHGITDGGHAHGVSDPGHVHSTAAGASVVVNNFPTAFGLSGTGNVGILNEPLTGVAFTNISISGAATGISVNGGASNVSVNSAGAGITFSAQGSNAGHVHGATSNAVATVPPYRAVNYIIKT